MNFMKVDMVLVRQFARQAGFTVDENEIFFGNSPDLAILLEKFAEMVATKATLHACARLSESIK